MQKESVVLAKIKIYRILHATINILRCRLAALAGSNGPWDKGPFGGGKSPMHEMAITAAKRHKPLFRRSPMHLY